MGHHVLRKTVNVPIVDFLSRRISGALLIGGRRKGGKTNAVISAIHTIVETAENEGVIVLPVLVDSNSFEYTPLTKDGPRANGFLSVNLLEFKRAILKILVKKLYRVMDKKVAIVMEKKDDNVYNKIANLFKIARVDKKKQERDEVYNKIANLFKIAVAKEFKEEIKNVEYQERKVQTQKETIVHFTSVKKLIGIGIALILSIILALHPVFEQNSIWNRILPLLIAIIPPIVISVTWKKSDSLEHGSDETASKLYSFIADVSDIQFELEDTLDFLSERHYKVIFVIDDLSNLPQEETINVILSLERLLTQTSALFVLIVGDEFVQRLRKAGQYRSNEYFLFSERIFLQRPLFEEIREFIDNIVLWESEEFLKNKEYETFKDYACYASKSDFFDLYNVLGDHLSYSDRYLALNLELDQKQITQAKFQTAMESIYLKKKYLHPLDWLKNDQLLGRMYDLITKLTDPDIRFVQFQPEQSQLRIIFLNNLMKIKHEVLADDEIQGDALTDVIEHLLHSNFLYPTSTRDQYGITILASE